MMAMEMVKEAYCLRYGMLSHKRRSYLTDPLIRQLGRCRSEEARRLILGVKPIENLRRDCFWRDGYKCRVCGKRVTWNTGHMAHVISRGRQGPDELNNVVTKCEQCHLEFEHRPKSVKSKI